MYRQPAGALLVFLPVAPVCEIHYNNKNPGLRTEGRDGL